jgi:hypothetical protein
MTEASIMVIKREDKNNKWRPETTKKTGHILKSHMSKKIKKK